MIRDFERLDRVGLAAAFEADLEAVGRNLGVPDLIAYKERVLFFPDVGEILDTWERVRPEWRSMLVAELKGCARDVANSYKTECQRCGRCCHCQIYVEAADCERGTIRPEHVEVLAEGRFIGGELIDDWPAVWESGAVVRMKKQESGGCVFHDEATHLCSIHEGRANHCRNFFCHEDIQRRERFSFPDLVQHLEGQGHDMYAIAVVFINLCLWRKADELLHLDAARRREFGEMLGLHDEAALNQFLGPSFEVRIREAAARGDGGPVLKEYAARLGGTS
ncbi:MAG: YkgJ family cysteine cluster protein [Pseudomonadota bacterium]